MSIDREHPESTRDAPVSALAFARLYAATFLQVKAFLARKGCGPSSLDDLAQESFLRAWRGWQGFSNKSSFRTWLFAIARNVLREHQRQLVRAEPFEDELLLQMNESGPTYAEDFDALRVAVDRLPSKQRQAIRLVYFDEFSPVQAAERAGCKPKVLHQRLADARAQLSIKLGVRCDADRG